MNVAIAKSGYDAETETDPRNLSFNLSNIYKIAFTGQITVSVHYVDDGYGSPLGSAESSFLHNLGYIPVAFAFSEDYGQQIPSFFPAGAGVSIDLSYRLTSSRIYISVYDTGVMGGIGDDVDFTFRYQIMHDKIV